MNPSDYLDLSGRTITAYCLSMHLYPWDGQVVSKHVLILAETLHYFIGGPAAYIGVIAREIDQELRHKMGAIPRHREWEMSLVEVL